MVAPSWYHRDTMREPAPHDKILAILRTLSAVEAQNRLLRLSDQNLALSLLYMADWQHDFVLGFIGPAKQRRVRLEIERQLRSRIVYDSYLRATKTVIDTLAGEIAVKKRTYYRPRPRKAQ